MPPTSASPRCSRCSTRCSACSLAWSGCSALAQRADTYHVLQHANRRGSHVGANGPAGQRRPRHCQTRWGVLNCQEHALEPLHDDVVQERIPMTDQTFSELIGSRTEECGAHPCFARIPQIFASKLLPTLGVRETWIEKLLCKHETMCRVQTAHRHYFFSCSERRMIRKEGEVAINRSSHR